MCAVRWDGEGAVCDVGGVWADETQMTLDPEESSTVMLEAQPVFGWTIPDGVDGEEVTVSVNEIPVKTVTVESRWEIDPEGSSRSNYDRRDTVD